MHIETPMLRKHNGATQQGDRTEENHLFVTCVAPASSVVRRQHPFIE